MQGLVEKNYVKYIKFSIFDQNVTAIYTTRFGGVSRGRYASMNLSFSNGDSSKNVLQNYKNICECEGINHHHLVFSQQEHTDNIRVISKEDIGKGITKRRDYHAVDALISNIPDCGLVTQYADCIPLLFYDKVHKVIAAAHGGWRGTVAEIARKTVEKMTERFGCNPADIVAAIGPGICQDCYEVDEAVSMPLRRLNGLDFSECLTELDEGKFLLDLKEVNRQIMVNAGIKPENIEVSPLCTCCNSHIFHSHRATGGHRGNNAAIIYLR
ncbi:MAG: peptidoglycan editing factor PgeF [Oscillospiraceae bacterium]|nr:peptidoglycan editing factor PgeF [Candidatus Equicaccousia limihippi]